MTAAVAKRRPKINFDEASDGDKILLDENLNKHLTGKKIDDKESFDRQNNLTKEKLDSQKNKIPQNIDRQENNVINNVDGQDNIADVNIDRQENRDMQISDRQKRGYKKTSVNRMRNALLAALGEKEEAIIKQIEIQSMLRLSKPTWLAGIRELKNEFEIIKQRRGTLLRKKFDGQ